MALVVDYHPGGFKPAELAQNRARQWDSVSGLFTSWDSAGVQLEQRALVASESQMLAAIEASRLANQNTDTLRSRAQTALSNNAAFLAIPSPTNAEAVTQLKALTRQVNALIRLELSQLADITDS